MREREGGGGQGEEGGERDSSIIIRTCIWYNYAEVGTMLWVCERMNNIMSIAQQTLVLRNQASICCHIPVMWPLGNKLLAHRLLVYI